MAKATMYFPPDFRWGTATSSHQVEGNNTNNDWWAWEHAAAHIKGGDKSGQACDWWGAGFEQDMDFAVQMHTNAHRLSIEWSRIEPQEGHWDSAAIDRYRYMLLSMRRRGIEPMITLHHFSNPLWMAERDGWETIEAVRLFERFATKAAESFGDLCNLWITINEPNVYALMGYMQSQEELVDFATPSGNFPPGKDNLPLAFSVTEYLLRGHAAAYHALHRVQQNARVGIAHHMRVFDPARPNSLLDRWCTKNRDGIFNDIVLTAILKGRYHRPFGLPSWIRSLRDTADFIGLNYYTRDIVKFDRHAAITAIFGRTAFNSQAEMSDGNFGELYARGLYRLLTRLGRLGKPIYITENGLPDSDDDQRPGYLIKHLRMVWQAINQNVPVMGYYHWTLTDNFEWSEGWNLRFGLVALNPETQARQLRRSGEMYGEICRRGVIDDGLVYEYTPELVDTLFPG
jgi:beta-glucosidase